MNQLCLEINKKNKYLLIRKYCCTFVLLMEKTCCTCKQTLPLKDFYKRGENREKTRSDCKKCTLEKHSQYGFINYAVSKRRHLKDDFNITLEYYDDLVRKQNNKCAICKQEETALTNNKSRIKSLCVDHCHKTGKIRGLLCQKCNLILGIMKDNTELFKECTNYLEINK